MRAELLTDDELELMDLLGKTAGVFRRVIGDGPNAGHDWAETAHEIPFSPSPHIGVTVLWRSSWLAV